MQEQIFEQIKKSRIPIFLFVFLCVFPSKHKIAILGRKMTSNQKFYKTKIAQHKILRKNTSKPNLEYGFFIFM